MGVPKFVVMLVVSATLFVSSGYSDVDHGLLISQMTIRVLVAFAIWHVLVDLERVRAGRRAAKAKGDAAAGGDR